MLVLGDSVIFSIIIGALLLLPFILWYEIKRDDKEEKK